jgi:hypothetical protein
MPNKHYEVQMLEEVVGGHKFWYKDLWTWKIPLKIKLFVG